MVHPTDASIKKKLIETSRRPRASLATRAMARSACAARAEVVAELLPFEFRQTLDELSQARRRADKSSTCDARHLKRYIRFRSIRGCTTDDIHGNKDTGNCMTSKSRLSQQMVQMRSSFRRDSMRKRRRYRATYHLESFLTFPGFSRGFSSISFAFCV